MNLLRVSLSQRETRSTARNIIFLAVLALFYIPATTIAQPYRDGYKFQESVGSPVDFEIPFDIDLPTTHSEKPKPTPETSPTPGPYYTDREKLIDAADKFAIEHGWADDNGNGIPDFREHYVLHHHDCASVSAEWDNLLEQMGNAGALHPDQAFRAGQIRGGRHAANFVPGIGIVDVTPMGSRGGYIASSGRPWYNFPANSRLYQQGFPDRGEITFAGYTGPSANNIGNLSSRPFLGSGGFGEGILGGPLLGGNGLGNNMLLQALIALFNQSDNNLQQTPIVVVGTPTPIAPNEKSSSDKEIQQQRGIDVF